MSPPESEIRKDFATCPKTEDVSGGAPSAPDEKGIGDFLGAMRSDGPTWANKYRVDKSRRQIPGDGRHGSRACVVHSAGWFQ
jgi:hypothetical protein